MKLSDLYWISGIIAGAFACSVETFSTFTYHYAMLVSVALFIRSGALITRGE